MSSDAYVEALEDSKRHHETNKTFSGSLALMHAETIKGLVAELGIASILDYGAGKGIQYEGEGSLEKLWGVPVTKYDPAWPPFATEPSVPHDLVICTHALSCVPAADLPEIVDRLYALSKTALYVGELIGPVRKKVFRNPERMPHGWNESDWATALHRTGTGVRVFLGTIKAEDEERTVRVQQLAGPRL